MLCQVVSVDYEYNCLVIFCINIVFSCKFEYFLVN